MSFVNLFKLMNDIDVREAIYKKYRTGGDNIKYDYRRSQKIDQDFESATSKNDKEVSRWLRFVTVRYFYTLMHHYMIYIINVISSSYLTILHQ